MGGRVPRRGQRDRLRQGLSFLGLGSLGNGLFVTPHDLRAQVRDLIRRCGVEADVTLHHGTLEWPADPAQVVARAWDLKRLGARYTEFLDSTRQAGSARPPSVVSRRYPVTRGSFSRRSTSMAASPRSWS